VKKGLIPMLLIFILLSAGAIFAQSALPWKTYHNTRFGYDIEYPQTLIPSPESANGDGRVFASKDGKVELTIFGGCNALSQSLTEKFDAMIAEYKKNGKKVTYRAQGKTWFVISGIEGKNVFYAKTLRRQGKDGGEVDAAFIITYPYASKSIYDPVAERLSRSLCFSKEPL
jgi:hypothetical protein